MVKVKKRFFLKEHGSVVDLEPCHAHMETQRASRNSSGQGQHKQQSETRLTFESEATLEKQVPNQTTSAELQESSDQVGLFCGIMSRSAFAFKRTTRGFKLSFHTTRTLGVPWCLIASAVVTSGQYRIVLKDTSRPSGLGLCFLVVHSFPLHELEIFALVNHCFIVIVLCPVSG